MSKFACSFIGSEVYTGVRRSRSLVPLSTKPHQFSLRTNNAVIIRSYCTLPALENRSLLTKVIDTVDMYLKLSKWRLSSMVVVSSVIGYYMAPGEFNLSTFVFSTIGTTFAIFSANTFNQCIEVNSDKQMARTFKRVLPSGKMSRFHAALFGFVIGLSGVALLYSQVNDLAAGLALGNIILYAAVYTPLKKNSPNQYMDWRYSWRYSPNDRVGF